VILSFLISLATNTMNIVNENFPCALHAVVVPFPAQGHVNSLINLAQLLALRGFFITFVNTEWIHKRMAGVSTTNTDSLLSLVSRGDPDREMEQRDCKIRFLCIPDGLPPEQDRTSSLADYLLALQKLSPALEHLLRSSSSHPNANASDEKYSFPPVTFIVTDSFMSCTEQVATNMEVPRVIYWPFCAAASICQCYTTFLMSQGHIPVKSKQTTPSPPKLLTVFLSSVF